VPADAESAVVDDSPAVTVRPINEDSSRLEAVSEVTQEGVSR